MNIKDKYGDEYENIEEFVFKQLDNNYHNGAIESLEYKLKRTSQTVARLLDTLVKKNVR